MMCLPTRFEVDYFPQGFPDELLDKLRAFSGRNIVCNKLFTPHRSARRPTASTNWPRAT
ncbi:MAG: hypothetical protein ACLTSX_10130 [Collinsella sp.]